LTRFPFKTLRAEAKRQWRRYRQEHRNAKLLQTAHPHHGFIFDELKKLLAVDDEWLMETWTEFVHCRRAWVLLSGWRSPGRASDGVAKSLDVAEGFALWVLVKKMRPSCVVELGVQYGVSSRLWQQAMQTYVPDGQLILCDLEDKRRFISDQEATFYAEDARTLLPRLFASQKIDVLHNDAHPYDLIHWSVRAAIENQVPVLTFHDVGRGQRGVFKLESYALSHGDKFRHRTDWGVFGAWERHVMAELLDERILREDFVENDQWRIQIFDSLFGFGAAIRQKE